ncbi:MAG: hypothetical protein ABSB15_28595 [Bryobacteraceae bacterium]|jgi:hypothetical protein
MKAIVRRVARLEDRYAINSSGKLRIGVRAIISFPWKGPLSLATSTCRRTLNPGGAVTEIVELDGRDEDIDDEELEKFIASFPISNSDWRGDR